jgi:16S rRNA (guanine527-N7)-methyltransferase
VSRRPTRSGGSGGARASDNAGDAVKALVRRYGLHAGAAGALLALTELLAHDEHAPSAVRDPRAAVDVHLADSLVALELVAVGRAREIVDLGAGAGFPGLPLAIALPHAHLTLLEASARRAAFLERAVAVAGVSTVDVVNARAEEWKEGLGACDVVLARALAPLPVVVEYAAPLLRVGGDLIVWRGQRDAETERAAARAAAELGLEPAPPRRVHPYPGAKHRYLHLMSKVRATPARFPRRPGVALKRPLGVSGGA